MSQQPITMNYEEADKSLRIISNELHELKGGLKHLQVVFSDAAEKSNITFLKALTEKYDAMSHIFSRLTELVDEVRDGLKRYQKEYSAYEQQ
jgi:hypothetical protein